MSKRRTWNVESVFGHSLYEGVLFVSGTTIVLAIIVLLSCVGSLVSIKSEDNVSYKKQPVMAMNLIFALVAFSISIYQVIVSLLLLWQALKLKSNIFLSSVWYVSHLSIMVVYFVLFGVKVIVCFVNKQYLSGATTAVAGILYEAVFVYFTIIVNSYTNSIVGDRYM